MTKRALSLRFRLRLVSLVPTFLASTIIGLFSLIAFTYLNDVNTETRIEKTLKAAQVLFEVPLVTGNAATATFYADSILSDPDVIQVSLFDADGELLTRATRDYRETSETFTVSEPIYPSKLPTAVWEDEDEDLLSESLGTIELVISNDSFAATRTTLLIIFAAIMVGALLMSWLMGSVISRQIENPLRKISRAVAQIKQGNFSLKDMPKHPEDGELAILGANVEHLADALHDARNETETRMKELILSREETVRSAQENAEVLTSLCNEFVEPLVVASKHLQDCDLSMESNDKMRDIEAASLILENLLEMSGEYTQMIDYHSEQGKSLPSPFTLRGLLESILDHYTADLDIPIESRVIVEHGDAADMLDAQVYGDPIRIRIVLKCLLDYSIANAPSDSTIRIRTLARPVEAGVAFLIDIIDDHSPLSDDVLELLTHYFGAGNDYISPEEIESIPPEYRSANRISMSIGSRIALTRSISGGCLISFELVASLSEMKPEPLAPTPDALAIAYVHRLDELTSFADRVLSRSGVACFSLSQIAAAADLLDGYKVIVVETKLIDGTIATSMPALVPLLEDSDRLVIAAVAAADLLQRDALIDAGFSEVLAKPFTASQLKDFAEGRRVVQSTLDRLKAP